MKRKRYEVRVQYPDGRKDTWYGCAPRRGAPIATAQGNGVTVDMLDTFGRHVRIVGPGLICKITED